MEVQVHLPENFRDLLKDAVAAFLREHVRNGSGELDQQRLFAAAMAGLGPVRQVIVTTDDRVLVFEPNGEELQDLPVDDVRLLRTPDGPVGRLLPEDERARLLEVLDKLGLRLPTDVGPESRELRPRSSRPRRSGLDRRRTADGLPDPGLGSEVSPTS